MSEKNLEEPSCRYQRNEVPFYFINNHIAFKRYFFIFSLNVSFLHSMFMILCTKKSP